MTLELEPSTVPIEAPDRPDDDDAPAHAPAAVQSLRDAMRRARADDAERAAVLSDMRAARIGRLEILKDALAPLLAQIPEHIDLFDVALMPGATPRLFIDMIGFVEMGRDARAYQLVQDTRHGRVKLAESTQVEAMVDAVTEYVARRIIERDKALAADAIETTRVAAAGAHPDAAVQAKATPAPTSQAAALAAHQESVIPAATSQADTAQTPKSRRRKILTWAGIGFMFLIELLGAIAFFSILAGICWILWNKYHGPV